MAAGGWRVSYAAGITPRQCRAILAPMPPDSSGLSVACIDFRTASPRASGFLTTSDYQDASRFRERSNAARHLS